MLESKLATPSVMPEQPTACARLTCQHRVHAQPHLRADQPAYIARVMHTQTHLKLVTLLPIPVWVQP